MLYYRIFFVLSPLFLLILRNDKNDIENETVMKKENTEISYKLFVSHKTIL